MSLIKSSQDLSLLRQAGKKLAIVLRDIQAFVLPGVSLIYLNQKIHQQILSLDATPSFLNYEGFPAASCLSLNNQIVHGIPDQRLLKNGDILGIDTGLWYKGVCVDAAITLGIGKVSPEAKSLLEHTQTALNAGILAIKPYRRVGVISYAIQEIGEKSKHGIVRSLTGHGVGHHIHEEPEIPNFGHPSDGILIKIGMVLAIEPMFTNGQSEILTEIDGWGIVTADNSLAAQFEHTIIVTARGAEVITRLN